MDTLAALTHSFQCQHCGHHNGLPAKHCEACQKPISYDDQAKAANAQARNVIILCPCAGCGAPGKVLGDRAWRPTTHPDGVRFADHLCGVCLLTCAKCRAAPPIQEGPGAGHVCEACFAVIQERGPGSLAEKVVLGTHVTKDVKKYIGSLDGVLSQHLDPKTRELVVVRVAMHRSRTNNKYYLKKPKKKPIISDPRRAESELTSTGGRSYFRGIPRALLTGNVVCEWANSLNSAEAMGKKKVSQAIDDVVMPYLQAAVKNSKSGDVDALLGLNVARTVSSVIACQAAASGGDSKAQHLLLKQPFTQSSHLNAEKYVRDVRSVVEAFFKSEAEAGPVEPRFAGPGDAKSAAAVAKHTAAGTLDEFRKQQAVRSKCKKKLKREELEAREKREAEEAERKARNCGPSAGGLSLPDGSHRVAVRAALAREFEEKFPGKKAPPRLPPAASYSSKEDYLQKCLDAGEVLPFFVVPDDDDGPRKRRRCREV